MRAIASTWIGFLLVGVVGSCSLSSLDDLKAATAGPDGGGSSDAGPGDAAGSDGWPCTPTTCEAAGAACGQKDDGCNGVLECGACSSPETCTPDNQCECAPATCTSLGKQCGSEADGCGGTLECGSCATGQSCSGGQCVCAPKTCASVGWSCGGPLDDGCGGQLSCGACPGATTCVNHACQTGMLLSCGTCPTGYSSPFGVSNSACGAQSFCGQLVQNICVLASVTYVSACGGQCPPAYHLAGALDHCACPSTVNFCLPD